MTFIANDPGWKCVSNSSSCNYTSTIEPTSGEFGERCEMERKNWVFSDTSTSIVTEFDLVCDRSILKNVATSMVYFGWFIGAILFGYISDKWGRKKALLISMVVMSVPGVLSSFVGTFWLFALLKVLVGSGIGGALNCIVLLDMEFVGPRSRPFAGIFIWNFWSLGVCMVALFAYLIPDWKYLNLTTSIPGLLIVVIYFYLPESIRWLIVNDRHREAEEILKKVAEVNGRKYPADVELKKEKTSNESGNVFELFRHRLTTVYTLVSMLAWFACSMAYYGVSLSSGDLGGNIYLTFFLTSLIDFPSNFLATFMVSRFGRKRSLIVSMFGTAVSMITAALLPSKGEFTIAKIILAMIAKVNILVAFNAVTIVTFELLPTTLRNTGMGLSSAAARVGSFSAPYIIYLNKINRVLPFIIIGLVAVISAFVCFVLPETKDKPTQETISDGTVEELEINLTQASDSTRKTNQY